MSKVNINNYPQFERLTCIRKEYNRELDDKIYDLVDLSYISPYCSNVNTIYDITLLQLYTTIEYLSNIDKIGKIVVCVIDMKFTEILSKLYDNTEIQYITKEDDISKFIKEDITLICLNREVSNVIYTNIGINNVLNDNYLLILDIRLLKSKVFTLPSIKIIGLPYDNRGSTCLGVWCSKKEEMKEYKTHKWIKKLIYFNAFHRWNVFTYENSDELVKLVKYYEPTYDRVTEYYIFNEAYKKGLIKESGFNVNMVAKQINTIHELVEVIAKCTYIQKRFISYYYCLKDENDINIQMISNIRLLLYQEIRTNNSLYGTELKDFSLLDMYNRDDTLTSDWLPKDFRDAFKELFTELIHKSIKYLSPFHEESSDNIKKIYRMS